MSVTRVGYSFVPGCQGVRETARPILLVTHTGCIQNSLISPKRLQEVCSFQHVKHRV